MNNNNDILVSSEQGIKTITLNIPHKKNSLTPENAIRAAREIENSTDDGTRVIILTGAGGAFCSGAELDHGDIIECSATKPLIEEDNDIMISTSYHRMAKAVFQLPLPVIAAVNGPAAGFGCSLAFNADITLVSTTARFIEVFINISLIPDGGATYMLPKLIGMKKAMELALTGDPVSAEEALELRLVNRIYPPEELMEQARRWAHRLAEGPVKSMGVIKKTMYEAQQMDFEAVLDMESRRQARLMTKPNFPNAVMAFLQKKKPTFS